MKQYPILSYFYGVGETHLTENKSIITIILRSKPSFMGFEKGKKIREYLFAALLFDGVPLWMSLQLLESPSHLQISPQKFILSYQTIFEKYGLDLIAYQFYINMKLERKTLNKNWE